MQKLTFEIAKLDCPCEEQIVRMALENLASVHSLHFDYTVKQLQIYFSGKKTEEITNRLHQLNLGTKLLHICIENPPITDNNSKREQQLLIKVLTINLLFFVLEILFGWIAHSMGLIADSLDMLADSLVYALALFAVGRSITWKKNIAKISGYVQLLLAVLGLVEVIRRFIGSEFVPNFTLMIGVSVLALAGNLVCLRLLQKSKNTEAHIQASMIFTSNDLLANIGVIIAAVLVFMTSSKYPDLIIGSIIFLIVSRGAMKILKISKH